MTTLEGTGVCQPGAGTEYVTMNQPLGSFPRPCAINDLQLLERLAQIIGDLRLWSFDDAVIRIRPQLARLCTLLPAVKSPLGQHRE
jgi:hypothetical protein